MDEFNPYAPPKDMTFLESYPSGDDRVWRHGPLLVMTKGSQLPDRCLKCNLPAGGWRLERTELAPGGFPKRVTPRSSHSALRIQVATPVA